MRIEVCVIISDFELKKVILFTSLCTFGHAGSLLLHGLFSSCGEQVSHWGGFSYWGHEASVVAAHGLCSCGSQALEHRLSSCGARAWQLCGMGDLPGSGIELRWITTEPGKPWTWILDQSVINILCTCIVKITSGLGTNPVQLEGQNDGNRLGF